MVLYGESLCFLICVILGIVPKERKQFTHTQPVYTHSHTDILISFYGCSSIKVGVHTQVFMDTIKS